jgi:hypothetical protein
MVFQKLNIKLIFEQFKLQTNSNFTESYTIVKHLEQMDLVPIDFYLYEPFRNTVLGGYYQYNSTLMEFFLHLVYFLNVGAEAIFKME